MTVAFIAAILALGSATHSPLPLTCDRECLSYSLAYFPTPKAITACGCEQSDLNSLNSEVLVEVPSKEFLSTSPDHHSLNVDPIVTQYKSLIDQIEVEVNQNQYRPLVLDEQIPSENQTNSTIN
jgi:hypothetical protein